MDGEGNRVGRPLKSSLFGKQYGIGALEQTMAKSGEAIKADGIPTSTCATVAASLTGSDTGNEFLAQLREKGIDIVLRYGNGGRLFGATFIDHNTRTVLNGSALGKEFSANALGTRFPDLSTENRENRQPIQSPARDTQTIPAGETAARSVPTSAKNTQNETVNKPLRPTVQPAPDNHRLVTQPAAPVLPRDDYRPTAQSNHDEKQPQPIKSYGGDDSPVGSLLSMLTPEPERYDNNQPLPTHRKKKKKRKYGRQM